MNAFTRFAWAAVASLSLAACSESAELQVTNTMENAVLRNVRWGDIHVAGELIPGENSSKVTIYNDNNGFVDLPEEHPLRFYLDVDGDVIYLETREKVRLEIEQSVRVAIDDTTRVRNLTLDPD